MPFRKYEKIHRLGKEETDGILNGVCQIEEKIDGANTSVWLEDGLIQCGSRNRHLIDDDFNGFRTHILNIEELADYLHDHPTHILYGEWLVKHTIAYREASYRQWYLFDIYESLEREAETAGYEDQAYTRYVGKSLGIPTPWHMATLENPTMEQLQEYVGKSRLGNRGEGIVIKNSEFVNRWGDRCHAKLVHNDFMEQNALIFGGNNKHVDNYQELYFVNKYMTEARVKKIMQKVQPEINEALDLKHIPRICNTAYYDMITEEAWDIAKAQRQVDFKQLQKLAFNKAKLLYMEQL